MQGFEALFSDPMAALGYGLLTSRENPMGAAFGLLAQGEQMKQQRADSELRNKMLERQMRGLEVSEAAEARKQKLAEMREQYYQGGDMMADPVGMIGSGVRFDDPTLISAGSALYDINKDTAAQQQEQNFRDQYYGQAQQPQSNISLDMGYEVPEGLGQPEQLQPLEGMEDMDAMTPQAQSGGVTERPSAPTSTDSYMQELERLSAFPQSEARDSAMKVVERKLEVAEERKKYERQLDNDKYNRFKELDSTYLKTAQPYIDNINDYASALDLAKQQTGAADYQLIKMGVQSYDKRASAVTDDEFRNMAQAGAFGDIVQGQINRVISGAPLAPNLRQELLNSLKIKADQSDSVLSQLDNAFEKKAKGYGVDFNLIKEGYAPVRGIKNNVFNEEVEFRGQKYMPREAPDGNFYIEVNGQFYKVEQ